MRRRLRRRDGHDVVLEPSAGTGTLAATAALGLDSANGGRLALNELTSTRAGLLHLAFPGADVSRHDAEHIADLLPDLRPSVVVMTRLSPVGRLLEARERNRPAPRGGRLPGASPRRTTGRDHVGQPRPSASGWRDAFPGRQPAPDVLFTSPIAGRLYRSRGTTFETRLTVLEKPGEKTRGTVAIAEPAASAEDLLATALDALPPRLPLQDAAPARRGSPAPPRAVAPSPGRPRHRANPHYPRAGATPRRSPIPAGAPATPPSSTTTGRTTPGRPRW